MTSIFPHPIGILSFNRPRLLERVLRSLRAQTLEPDGSRICLFQDGGVSVDSGQRKAEPEVIADCIAVFRRWIPEGRVYESPYNLGIAGNRTRAERALFAGGEVPWAMFMEDDLLLGSRYLEVVERLRAQFEDRPMVASLAAYGDHRLPREEQERDPGALVVMKHAWACLERASFWRDRRILTDHYDALIAGNDYRDRPHWVIDALFEDLGYGNFFDQDHAASTSQDNLRTLATNLLGGVRYMTRTPYGLYIGDEGEHYDAVAYQQEGFAGTAVSETAPDSFAEVTEGVQRHNVLSYLNWNGRYMRRQHAHWLPLNGRANLVDAAVLSRRDVSPNGLAGRLSGPPEMAQALLGRLHALTPLSRFKARMFHAAAQRCGGTLVVDLDGQVDAMEALPVSPELLLLDPPRFNAVFADAPVPLLVVNDILDRMGPELRQAALRNLALALTGHVQLLALHVEDQLASTMQGLIARLVRDVPMAVIMVQAAALRSDPRPEVSRLRSRFPAIERVCLPRDRGWHVFLEPRR